ncbi:MAG: hypothetical protein HQM10_22655 [Candidatus Riflebacteria bacterium]|nr:hypothetical protein [Candidatus Riflebacteria bacterium]
MGRGIAIKVLFAFVCAICEILLSFPTFSCNPEPGPQHFEVPSPPINQPVPIKKGYFEVHNTLTGLPSNEILSILSDEGIVLAGSADKGLMIFKDNKWLCFSPESFPPFNSRTVSTIISHSPGKYLAGTPDGIIGIKAENDSFSFSTLTSSRPVAWKIQFLLKNNDSIWACTDNGICLFHEGQLFPANDPGNVNPIGACCGIIRNGLSLFGGNQGIVKIENNIVSPLFAEMHDSGWVQAFQNIASATLIGTSNALWKYDGKNMNYFIPDLWIKSMFLTPGLNDIPFKMDRSDEINSFESFLDSAKSHVEGQTVEVDPETKKLYEKIEAMVPWFKNPSNHTSYLWTKKSDEFFNICMKWGEMASPDLAKNSKELERLMSSSLLKGFWVGTNDSGVIFYANDGIKRNYTTDNSKLPGNSVTCISGDASGETWIGTKNSGILRYRDFTISSNKDSQLVWNGKSNKVKILGENLYICSEKAGLLVYSPKNIELVNHYKEPFIPGFHLNVSDVDIDSSGRLWVTGDRGVWMLDDKNKWRNFGSKDGLPSQKIDVIDIGANSKIYVSGGDESQISEQLAQFFGEYFFSYRIDSVKGLLSMGTVTGTSYLKELGLIGGYQREFDIVNASKALSLYEMTENKTEKITSLLGTPYYILMGTQAGGLHIFDGEGFKKLSDQMVGKPGQIKCLKQMPNGSILIVGENRIMFFDGKKYIPVTDSGMMRKYTGAAIDDLNSECFWVSFSESGSGGAAMCQDGKWQTIKVETPIRSIAVSDPFLFVADDFAVYRWTK